MPETGYSLHLLEDTLTADAGFSDPLPSRNRVLYVMAGTAIIDGKPIGTDQAWFGSGEVGVRSDVDTRIWRWELIPDGSGDEPTTGAGIAPTCKLSEPINTLELGDGKDWLMRCDSVYFPPGGCAYTHTHQGPGIRCLLYGRIRIDTLGNSTHYTPGDAWYESGPEPVFAQGAMDTATRFIRVMILPKALLGKRSISYTNEEDRTKPKSQQYQGYCDVPIEVYPAVKKGL